MAVPEGGRTDSREPLLCATARRDGNKVWSGVMSPAVSLFSPIDEQFTDSDLKRLYREARAGRQKADRRGLKSGAARPIWGTWI